MRLIGGPKRSFDDGDLDLCQAIEFVYEAVNLAVCRFNFPPQGHPIGLGFGIVNLFVQTKHGNYKFDQLVIVASFLGIRTIKRMYRESPAIFDEYLLETHFEFVEILFAVVERNQFAIKYPKQVFQGPPGSS
jgi:hypothetical protein